MNDFEAYCMLQLSKMFDIFSELRKVAHIKREIDRLSYFSIENCLNKDLICFILCRTPLPNYKSVSLVCKNWNSIMNTNSYWRHHSIIKLTQAVRDLVWIDPKKCADKALESFFSVGLEIVESRKTKYSWLFGDVGRIFRKVADDFYMSRSAGLTTESLIVWFDSTGEGVVTELVTLTIPLQKREGDLIVLFSVFVLMLFET